MIHIILQCLQKEMDMISIRSCVMAGQRQWHQNTTILLNKFSGFNRREIIWLILIAVNSKMLKTEPRNAGYCVSIFRRRCLWLAQYTMIMAEVLLMINIGSVKLREIFVLLRPH